MGEGERVNKLLKKEMGRGKKKTRGNWDDSEGAEGVVKVRRNKPSLPNVYGGSNI